MIQRITSELQISFEQSGTATSPALVLLHAFPLSSAMWHAQLERFSSHFRVIAPDARGVKSTSPFTNTPSVELLAHDLAALLDALEIETAIVGGCSMGGYTALEFARQFSLRLRGLILCDTRADADSPEAKKVRDEMMLFAREHDGLAVADKMLPKLLCDQTRETKSEVVELVRDLARSLSGENVALLVQSLRDRRDSTSILPSIKVPTLAIGGREDVPSPPDVMAKMASLIPIAKHVVVEESGHLSSLEQSEIWNREVEMWLEENGL